MIDIEFVTHSHVDLLRATVSPTSLTSRHWTLERATLPISRPCAYYISMPVQSLQRAHHLSSRVMTTTKSRVAVIGAGSAGLAVVQQLRSIEGDRTFKRRSLLVAFQIVVYERRGDVGGLWNFDQDPGTCVVPLSNYGEKRDSTQVQSSGYASNELGREFEKSAMYDGLRCVSNTDSEPTFLRYGNTID